MLAVDVLDGYVLIGENVCTHLVRVIDNIPKVLYQLFGIRQINGVQGLVIVFLNTEQNNTAERVGERRVGFPNATGQTAYCLFRFDAVILFVFFYVGKINHR